MAIAFSRTMRSLDADGFRGPRIVWAAAAILLAAWTWWFLDAQIPVPAGTQCGGGTAMRTTPADLAWRAIKRSPESDATADCNKQ